MYLNCHFDKKTHTMKSRIPSILSSLFFGLLLMGIYGFSHDFYMTVSHIDHNEKTDGLEITIKLFTEDIEKALREEYGQQVFLDDEKRQGFVDSLLMDYLNYKMELVVNEQAVEFEFVGKEVEIESTWCYVEVENVPQVRQIEVRNELLTELFDSQTNLIHLNIAQEKRTMSLNRNRPKEVAVF